MASLTLHQFFFYFSKGDVLKLLGILLDQFMHLIGLISKILNSVVLFSLTTLSMANTITKGGVKAMTEDLTVQHSLLRFPVIRIMAHLSQPMKHSYNLTLLLKEELGIHLYSQSSLIISNYVLWSSLMIFSHSD